MEATMKNMTAILTSQVEYGRCKNRMHFITWLQSRSTIPRTDWSLDDLRSCDLNIVTCFCVLIQVVLEMTLTLEIDISKITEMSLNLQITLFDWNSLGGFIKSMSKIKPANTNRINHNTRILCTWLELADATEANVGSLFKCKSH